MLPLYLKIICGIGIFNMALHSFNLAVRPEAASIAMPWYIHALMGVAFLVALYDYVVKVK